MHKKIKIRALAIALFAILCVGSASAREFSVEECVDSALAFNPSLKAAYMSVERAGALKGTAFNPPYTSVVLKQETTGGGGPENGVAFSQEFDFPSVYVARHKSLSEQESLEKARLNMLIADVDRDVRKAYSYLQLYAELIRLNDELEGIYQEFVRVANARLEAGESGKLEVMNAERMCEKTQSDRSDLLSLYENRQLELGRLTGIDTPIVPLKSEYQPLPYTHSSIRFEDTWRGRAAFGEVAVADREVAVAKNEFLPGLHLGATVQALIKSFNPYHIERLPFEKGNFMGFEVGVSVPLFFGAPSSRLKAARLESRISRLNMEAAEDATIAESEGLRLRISTLKEKLNRYTGVALPRADEIRRIALVSYRLGDIDYWEYISNIDAAYSVYREYAESVNEYNQAVLDLQNLMGCQ